VINIAGCPSHADWITGTLTHLLLYGLPELDAYNRPKLFFGRTIHDLCQRRQLFEDGIFAAFPGEPGCLYKVGCKGPVTHADCPLRQWNNHVNWPVKAGTPCIGCASPHFPDGMMPFYNHLPDIQTPAVAMNVKKIGAAFAALAVGAVGSHLAAGVFARRIHKHYLDGTKPGEPTPPENLEQVKQELDDLIRQQKVLLNEAKMLEAAEPRRRKRSLFRRVLDFWRTEDKSGKDK
jgi:hydrogenase small subunit